MDKNKLIAVLAYKLEESGISREAAVAEAKAFVGSLSDAEADKIVALVGNEAMMDRIAATLKRKAESRAARAAAATRNPVTSTASPIIDQENAVKPAPREPRLAAETPAPSAKPAGAPAQSMPVSAPTTTQAPAAVKSESAPVTQQRSGSQSQPPRRPQTVQSRMAGGTQGAAQGTAQGATPSKKTGTSASVRPRSSDAKPAASKSQGQNAQNGREKRIDKKLIYRPDPNADYQKFYIIFWCTSPIWIFLGLAVLTLFLLTIGALCVSIVLLILALVAGAAAGTVLSLVGIVYGITQLFNYAPIGLYEIGLGLMIGGITMFAGIIAYNVAIRLIPFVIKQLFALLSFLARKCVELYFYAKGACAGL